MIPVLYIYVTKGIYFGQPWSNGAIDGNVCVCVFLRPCGPLHLNSPPLARPPWPWLLAPQRFIGSHTWAEASDGCGLSPGDRLLATSRFLTHWRRDLSLESLELVSTHDNYLQYAIRNLRIPPLMAWNMLHWSPKKPQQSLNSLFNHSTIKAATQGTIQAKRLWQWLDSPIT